MMVSEFPPGPAYFALFDDSLGEGPSRLLSGHRGSLVCRRAAEAADFFHALERERRAGRWLALLADYAAGCWFESRLQHLADAGGEPPLLRAEVFDHCREMTGAEVTHWLNQNLAQLGEREACAGLADLQPELSEVDFAQAVARIRQYIAAGDVYQVNFTFALNGRTYGDPLALYARLRQAQPVRYGGYLRLPGRSVLSLSPELFLERRGDTVTSQPMKGTAPRGATPAEDGAAAAALLASEKNRAENLMIVDLIRNDLGRLAAPGAVRVDSLFRLESYPTLHQLVSAVSAELPGHDLQAVFRALFPCGSITGAPKIRAMEIIAELEHSSRSLYTGALGWLAPNGDFLLNVPIRTLVRSDDGQIRLGVGAGIVQDSQAAAEWQECLAKARFATGLEPCFGLIESLRLEPDNDALYPLLELHLDRLETSCRVFGFPVDINFLRWQLLSHGADYSRRRTSLAKTRLLVRKDGTWEIESSPLPSPAIGPVGVVWANEKVSSDDLLQRHKTSHRPHYDRELARIGQLPGVFDALFLNEKGEVAEGARSNVFVSLAGRLYTPPLSCGVLDGVARRRLLASGEAEERILRREDILQAEAIFLSNAVRGLMPAQMVG